MTKAFKKGLEDRDPVIEAFKKDIDRTLLRENLKLTPEVRLRKIAITISRGLNFTLRTWTRKRLTSSDITCDACRCRDSSS